MENKIINLKDLFDINKGDIISVVGSGGKTTLVFSLAEELRQSFNVLLTTSTKIFKPSCHMYDHLYTAVNSFIDSSFYKENGLTIISKSIDQSNNKLIGIDDNDLVKIFQRFDIIIIEADGSKELPVKGWKKHEPPVLQKTNKTIGVFPIKFINKKIEQSYIYGYEEFIKIVKDAQYLNYEAVLNICTHEEGLFKNSKGEKYLFINQADDDELIQKSFELAKYLNENMNDLKFKICFGSLKNGEYYEY